MTGDAAATAANIVAGNSLFRFGIVCFLVSSLLNTAQIYFFYRLMRPAAALRWLQRGTDRGFIHHPFLSERDPLLRSLRGDQRFAELMETVRARWERFEDEVDTALRTAPMLGH